MSNVHVKMRNPGDKDEFEKLMKIFKRKCQKAGFIQEIRKRRYFVKPSEKRRMAKREAQRNAQRRRK